MDKLKVTKVDSVLVQHISQPAGSRTRTASLHLTRHHLIVTFRPQPESIPQADEASADDVPKESPSQSEAEASQTDGGAQTAEKPPSPPTPPSASKELWIPYSLISILSRLPPVGPRPSRKAIRAGLPVPPRAFPLLIRTRTFETYALGFATEAVAVDVWESVRACTAVSASNQLYAFFYSPQPPLPAIGWSIYDFKKEFARQGVGSRTKAWRFTTINNAYGFCSTYPNQLVVPSRISDTTLGHASKYRSKERIPALAYLHWANLGSITRSSQPMVGLKQARSVQDEKLIEAIFTSHLFADPHSSEAAAAAAASASGNLSNGAALPGVYGATLTNLIIDARPTTNAVANTAKGAGTENMDHYRGCKKAYLGIDNIHVMRDSLNRVYDAVKEAESPATFGLAVSKSGKGAAPMPAAGEESDGGRTAEELAGRDSEASSADVASLTKPSAINVVGLKRSNWLKHITTLLEGSVLIARNVHVHSSHVLIHCSDGWDRTSQLSALAQLMLDPYYRTLEGFAVLIEKDWLSFGHRFHDRCGHLSSGKRFVTVRGDEEGEDSGGTSDSDKEAEPQGFETQAANAFWGFTRQLTAGIQGATGSGTSHLKETSPVFHQFLECVWQIQRQFPHRFEFGEDLLLQLHEDLYACRFGTFLNNSEKERRAEGTVDKTRSVWDLILTPEPSGEGKALSTDYPAQRSWRNPLYDPMLDDPKRANADMGVILPDPRNVRFWAKLFGKEDAEMNAMVDVEVEERRRAKALREKLARSAREESARDRGVSNVRVVEGSSDDPVLSVAAAAGGKTGVESAADKSLREDVLGPEGQKRHGAVDLATGFDPTKLAYKPRAPRSTGPPATTAPRPLASRENSDSSVSRGSPATALPEPSHAVSSSASEASFNLQSQAAAEAAARMKGLFLGGWGRLQDAVAGVTSGPTGDEAQSTGQGLWNAQSQSQSSASLPTRRGAQPMSDAEMDSGSIWGGSTTRLVSPQRREEVPMQRPNGLGSPPLPSQLQATRSPPPAAPAPRSGLDELNATIPAGGSYLRTTAPPSNRAFSASASASPLRDPYSYSGQSQASSESLSRSGSGQGLRPQAPSENSQQNKGDSYDPLGVGLG